MKKHPILNLFCNEEGTEIIFEGRTLHISYTLRNNRKESGTVSIKGHKVSVARVVCECYYGMRSDKSFFPVRKDCDATNNHYTNLSWGKRRGKLKISATDREELNKLFTKDFTSKELAEKFNVSVQTIRSYKRAYLKDNSNS